MGLLRRYSEFQTPDLWVNMDTALGSDVVDIVRTALRFAQKNDCGVRFQFMDVPVDVKPSDTERSVLGRIPARFGGTG